MRNDLHRCKFGEMKKSMKLHCPYVKPNLLPWNILLQSQNYCGKGIEKSNMKIWKRLIPFGLSLSWDLSKPSFSFKFRFLAGSWCPFKLKILFSKQFFLLFFQDDSFQNFFLQNLKNTVHTNYTVPYHTQKIRYRTLCTVPFIVATLQFLDFL